MNGCDDEGLEGVNQYLEIGKLADEKYIEVIGNHYLL